MYAFNYLYITDILSKLNLIEKWEMALFSPFVVLKYDLFFPFLLLHFLQILLFSCLLIVKINHTLVIMIHLQAFISPVAEKGDGPFFCSFSTSSSLLLVSFLLHCVVGRETATSHKTGGAMVRPLVPSGCSIHMCALFLRICLLVV